MMMWLVFAASAAAIVVAGARLSRCGDQIADLTGVGRLWIGVVLMSAATSLPEVFTTVSAAWMDAPDLAAGDLFGAGLSNMLTLGLIDLLHRQKRVWQTGGVGTYADRGAGHGVDGAGRLFRAAAGQRAPSRGGARKSDPLHPLRLGMRLVFRQEDMERRQREREAVVHGFAEQQDDGTSRDELRRAGIGFAAGAVVLLAAAPFLAWSAERIAEETGATAAFIGTSLVAITTSLPELVTAIAAVRLGAFGLAVGNVFGSNAFNMAAFFFADAAYRGGGLLSSVTRRTS